MISKSKFVTTLVSQTFEIGENEVALGYDLEPDFDSDLY